nr:unnamed protein product [Callosobruchus chinensis]
MVYGWSIHSELWHPYQDSDKTKLLLQSCEETRRLRKILRCVSTECYKPSHLQAYKPRKN